LCTGARRSLVNHREKGLLRSLVNHRQKGLLSRLTSDNYTAHLLGMSLVERGALCGKTRVVASQLITVGVIVRAGDCDRP
jgi:hypothetical protein